MFRLEYYCIFSIEYSRRLQYMLDLQIARLYTSTIQQRVAICLLLVLLTFDKSTRLDSTHLLANNLNGRRDRGRRDDSSESR